MVGTLFIGLCVLMSLLIVYGIKHHYSSPKDKSETKPEGEPKPEPENKPKENSTIVFSDSE